MSLSRFAQAPSVRDYAATSPALLGRKNERSATSAEITPP